MATSADAGFSAVFEISTDGGSTYTKVSESADITFSISGNPIEVTNNDSGGNEEYIPGVTGATMDVTANRIEADAGQLDIYNNIDSNTTVDVAYEPTGTGGDRRYEATAVVDTFEESGDPDSEVSLDASFQLTGALTKTTV